MTALNIDSTIIKVSDLIKAGANTFIDVSFSASDNSAESNQALTLAILIPVTVYQYTAKAAFVRELAGESDWEDQAEEEEEPAQAEDQMQEKGENQNAE